MAQTINVTVEDVTDTINVTVSDATITIQGSGLVIDGFQVVKGAGNTDSAIEVNDKIAGWIGDVYVAGIVTSTPVNDVSDVNTAVQGEAL